MPTCNYMQKDCHRYTGPNGEGPPITFHLLDVNSDIMWDSYCNHECLLQDLLQNIMKHKSDVLERFSKILGEFAYVENHEQMTALIDNNNVTPPPPPIPETKVNELKNVDFTDHLGMAEELAKLVNLLTAPIGVAVNVTPVYAEVPTKMDGIGVMFVTDKKPFASIRYEPNEKLTWQHDKDPEIDLIVDGIFSAKNTYYRLIETCYQSVGIDFPKPSADKKVAAKPKRKLHSSTISTGTLAAIWDYKPPENF